jgi:preprotein translocase subunit Sec63
MVYDLDVSIQYFVMSFYNIIIVVMVLLLLGELMPYFVICVWTDFNLGVCVSVKTSVSEL